ncbi:TerB family tellurite resistance protein [bacterium]|nr:TerB family tellurite resistance protein [bacterium]
MDNISMATMKGLVYMMWADGIVDDAEREFMGHFAASMNFSPEELKELAAMMNEQPNGDLDVKELVGSMDERERVYKSVAAMAVVDGYLAAPEKKMLENIARHLEIPAWKANRIIDEVKAGISEVRPLRED